MVVNVLDAWCVITDPLSGSSSSAQACRPPQSTTEQTGRDTSPVRRRGTRRAYNCHGLERVVRSRGLTTDRLGSIYLPRYLLARPTPTLTLARQKCATDVPRPHATRLQRSRARTSRNARKLSLARRIANSIRFPFNGFTYSLTLFSKSFSSFPHGTCSLSVSCRYLALDGVYHPFWAAFPNNPTL